LSNLLELECAMPSTLYCQFRHLREKTLIGFNGINLPKHINGILTGLNGEIWEQRAEVRGQKSEVRIKWQFKPKTRDHRCRGTPVWVPFLGVGIIRDASRAAT